jgi:hypothetical protein
MPDSREGGQIQVLAGLAPSSQTVGSNKERTGAVAPETLASYKLLMS